MVRVDDSTVSEPTPSSRVQFLLISETQLASSVRQVSSCVGWLVSILEIESGFLCSAESRGPLRRESLEGLLLEGERSGVFSESTIDKGGGVRSSVEERK